MDSATGVAVGGPDILAFTTGRSSNALLGDYIWQAKLVLRSMKMRKIFSDS